MLPAEKFFVPSLWLEDIRVVMSGRTTVVGMLDLWRYISGRKDGASRLQKFWELGNACGPFKQTIWLDSLAFLSSFA